jgi:hypothetical protein
MTPLFSSALVTNYLSTCISWSSLLGFETEPPSFVGGLYLGLFFFLGAWMLMSLPALLKADHRRAKRRPWPTFVRESVFTGEAAGWATTLQLALWMFLKAAVMYL